MNPLSSHIFLLMSVFLLDPNKVIKKVFSISNSQLRKNRFDTDPLPEDKAQENWWIWRGREKFLIFINSRRKERSEKHTQAF